MRERGSCDIATVLLAVVLALLVAPLFMGIVLVDVETHEPEAHRIIVPVPLAVARLAVAFAPSHELQAKAPTELTRYRTQILQALDELENAGDATLVTVHSRDEEVHIALQDGKLVFDVKDHGEVVRGALPLRAVRRVLERWDGRSVQARMALDFLDAIPRGEFLTVDSSDATVHLRML